MADKPTILKMKKLLLIGLVLILLSSFVTAQVSFFNNIVAGYHFTTPPDNNTLVIDDVGNNDMVNDGAVVSRDRDGNANKSRYLDHSDEDNFDAGGQVITSSDWSVSLWVNETYTAGSSFFCQRTGIDVCLFYSNNDFYLDGINTPNSARFDDYYTPSTGWHHFVFTFQNSGEVHKMYMDGIEKSQTDTASITGITNGNMMVGSSTAGATYYSMEGNIDEVLFINKTINLTEVIELNQTFDQWDEITLSYLNTISAVITPPAASTSRDLYGAAEINGSGTINAYWKWYVNDTLNITGFNSSLSENTLTNLSKIDSSDLVVNEEWIFSVLANNATANATWINSSTVTITSSTPSITNLDPSTEQYVRTVINASFTYIDQDLDPGTCSIYFNDVFNQTKTGITNGSTAWFSPRNMTIGSTIWYITCTDGTSNDTTSTLNYYYDPVNPFIITNFVNNSVYFVNGLLQTQFNFSDETNVYRWNLSIDGTQVNGSSDLNQSSFNTTLNVSLTSYGAGVHVLTATVADGHTAEELEREWDFDNGLLFDDYSKYTIDNNVEITTERKDKDWRDEWESQIKKDRHIQIYRPHSPAKIITFVEESNYLISIINRPGLYNDWWIITENIWKDYVLVNQPNAVISIERINDYKVEVTITNDEIMDELHFNSIGELNIVTQNYTFSTYNVTQSWPSYAIELFNQQHILNIHRGNAVSFANFTYNGTVYNPVKTSNATHDVFNVTFIEEGAYNFTYNNTFFWNFTVINATTLSNQSEVNWHTRYLAFLDNCTESTTRALNFSIIESTNSTPLIGDISSAVRIWGDDDTKYKWFNRTYEDNSDYGLCMLPTFAEFNATGTFISTVTGRPGSKTRTITDYDLDNITELITFNWNVNEQQAIFTIIDQDANPIPSMVVTIKEVDSVTGNRTTVDTLTTDSNGVIIGTFILNDQLYEFDFTLNSVLVDTQGPFLVISTDNTIRIILISDYIVKYSQFRQTSCNMTANNDTQQFNFYWNNAESETVIACLDIVERSLLGDTTVNESCTTAVSGNIILTIPGTPNANTYLASGTITQGNNTFLCANTDLNYNLGFKTYNTTGLFLSFLFILTMTMIGLWNPVAAILLNIGAVIMMNVLGLFQLNWVALVCFVIVGFLIISKLNHKT